MSSNIQNIKCNVLLQAGLYGTAKKKRPGYLVGNLVATNWPIEKALHAIGYNQIPTKQPNWLGRFFLAVVQLAEIPQFLMRSLLYKFLGLYKILVAQLGEPKVGTLQPERNARTKLTNSTNCKFSCIQLTCKFGQILAKFLFSPGVSFWLYGINVRFYGRPILTCGTTCSNFFLMDSKNLYNTSFTNSIMRIISALFGRKIETGPE